jgi:hypothetical protein
MRYRFADAIRMDGPPMNAQNAITGSQIAQPSDECSANGTIGSPRRARV